jgi:hypothetical protein
MCSPVPMKTTGALVTATADRAPPPLAVPSSLVMMTPVTWTASWNAFACDSACWPTAASMTRNFSSGLAAAKMRFISSMSESSSLSRR